MDAQSELNKLKNLFSKFSSVVDSINVSIGFDLSFAPSFMYICMYEYFVIGAT